MEDPTPRFDRILDAFERMGKSFLGLGNPAAPHWFCGLEPGGSDAPDWPWLWATKYHGAEVIDGRLEVDDPGHGRRFGPNAILTQLGVH